MIRPSVQNHPLKNPDSLLKQQPPNLFETWINPFPSRSPQMPLFLKRELIPHPPKKITAWILSFSCQSCVFLPFLFFSFLSSTLPTWEDNSPARKMIFLPLNHAAALFPSSLNVDSLSIYIHPGPFFSFFILFIYFFQMWTEYLSIMASKFPFLKKPSPLINLPNPIEAR